MSFPAGTSVTMNCLKTVSSEEGSAVSALLSFQEPQVNLEALPSNMETVAASHIAKDGKKPDRKDEGGDCPLKCAVPCCKRTGQRLYQTTFFPCPLEPHPSSRLWAKAIGVRTILKNMYICEDHFQLEDDLESYLKYKYYPRGQQRFPRFKKGVVPWKFPKCCGTSPTVHRHRVPISKTELYKRQKARANRARGLRRKNGDVTAKRTIIASETTASKLPKSNESGFNANAAKRPAQEAGRTSSKSGKRSSGSRTATQSTGQKQQEAKEGDYFDMLNGDLSTLIAHVQPAICSWDVSEVRPVSSQVEKTNGSECNSGELPELNEGRRTVDGSAETSFQTPKNSKSNSKSKCSKQGGKMVKKRSSEFDSELSWKSDAESEEEIYMTPSEDEASGDQDTSDTDFAVSSEESDEDLEFDKPTRRSLRNRSQKNHRPDRYSPPVVLRSRAKRSSGGSSLGPVSSPKGASPMKTRTDSGVSSELGTEPRKAMDVNDCGGVDGSVSDQVESGRSDDVLPLDKESRPAGSPKKARIEKDSPRVMRAVSGNSSDSEPGESPDDPKTDESSLPKPTTQVNSATAVEENPKWRFRAAKPSVKGELLTVDLSETVARVLCQESQTSYSYKKVLDEKKPGSLGNHSRKRRNQDKFLLVRDGDSKVASSEKLPPQICGLVANMRNTFASFFHTMDELRRYVNNHHSEKPVDSCLADPCISGMVDELTKFPDLLELEMAHFALKCEKFYDDEAEKKMKTSKKIRWCNTCQSAARFHCCFSAAYCSRLCQGKDWGRHNRYCGQSRMLLDDPDLKLNPFMANRLKALEYFKPSIGLSMSNLEELHQTVRRNGQKIVTVRNQPKTVKKSSGTCVISNPLSKVKRPNYTVRSYLPANMGPSASRNKSAPLEATVLQSSEEENVPIKTEPLDMDMEVEQGSPPPRPKPGIIRPQVKSGLVAVSSPNQQVRITIPSNLVGGFPSNVRPVLNRIGQSNTTTVNSAPRITAVAVVPKSTNGGTSLVLPKPTGASPVTLRCRTVVLPTGETQYIPVDGQTWSFKPNSQLVVKHVNQTSGTPVTVIKQATTSGSILITRPAKPAYSKFIPVSSPSTPAINTIVNPRPESPEIPPLTPRLPKLTPVMKSEVPAVRTLDSSELDKILSTDHLKEAFDMSYASNILRP